MDVYWLKCLSKPLSVLLLVTLLFSIGLTVKAQGEKLVLEWEQHWPTYGVGGTCNFGTHNFFVGDVDDDGVLEMITGGLTYSKPDYSGADLEAPLRIWNWNGENFTLEANFNWAGVLQSIYAADLDGDGKPEIITGGLVMNSPGGSSSIRVWSWNNKDLVLKANYEGISARSIFSGDVDNDGVQEILTVGSTLRNQTTLARLCILGWEENKLYMEKSHEWCTDGNASANSVYAYDLDRNGAIEIITGGSDHGLTNSSGQLRIWHWNGQELQLRTNEEWRMVEDVYGVTVTGDPMGNTLVENVKVGDVDGDGTAEIVTGGFAYDGQKMNAQVRIWNWNGNVFALEKSNEWFINDITEVKAITLNDVDGDERIDIVASGGTAVYGGFNAGTTPEASWLRIWLWNGETLKLKYQEDWTTGEGVFAWNVATGDVDNDGTVEIVTVGCMYISQLCDPDLRIWSVQTAPDFLTSNWLVITAVVAAASAILVGTAAFFLLRKRRSESSMK